MLTVSKLDASPYHKKAIFFKLIHIFLKSRLTKIGG